MSGGGGQPFSPFRRDLHCFAATRRGARSPPVASRPTFNRCRPSTAVNWQYLIVALAVLWAVAHVVMRTLRLWRPAGGPSCAGACTGCGSSRQTPLVSLDLSRRDTNATSPPGR